MDTTFAPTDKQNLYIRQPLGVYYARLYIGGKTKWISLKTRSKAVAKIELAKRLQTHYTVREAEASTRKGNATVGELAAIYLHGVDQDTCFEGVPTQDRQVSASLLAGSRRPDTGKGDRG